MNMLQLLFLLIPLLPLQGDGQDEHEQHAYPVSLSTDQPPADLLIVNGRILDGSGAPARRAELLIRDGVIRQILSPEEPELSSLRNSARRVIDANGRMVTPGFIDLHSHGDPSGTPRFENFLSMGVTTISLGLDGSSPGGADVAGWMEQVGRQGTGPNILHLTGHGTLRTLAAAPASAPLPEDVLRNMNRILEAALDAGSFGLSLGLEYIPGRFAGMEELVSLARTVASREGVIMSHMRSEDDDRMEESVRELLEQGRLSGAHVHVSHIKSVYARRSERADAILELLREARREGIRVTADLYPYTASYTGIGILFPEWALPPHSYDEALRTRREELAEHLRQRVQSRNGPQATLFGTAPWAGMTLTEMSDSLGKPFEEVLMDEIGPRGASAAYFVMNEEVMRRFMLDPMVMISSDGSPTMRHPRGYGSFARIIHRYVRQEGLLGLEEAVRKMSALPAATLGLDDPARAGTPRGRIETGFAADLLIFDPNRVRDRATFEEPHLPAEGFDYVIVNGVPVIEEGRANRKLPGTVIRRRDR